MLIYYTQLSLDEGFDVLDQSKHDRLVKGRQVSACSGWALFKTLRGKPIKCWSCGCEADRWIADQGRRNYQGYPVLNLYAARGDTVVLMTRDHIIPKSLGGLDHLENLRPACSVCNEERGNAMTEEDLQFRKDHPHLISEHRLEQGKENARRSISLLQNEEDRERLRKPFHVIGEEL